MKRRCSVNASILAALGIMVLFVCTGCVERVDLSGLWSGPLSFDQGDDMAGTARTLNLVLTQEGPVLSGKVGMELWIFSILIPITRGSFASGVISIEAAGEITMYTDTSSIAMVLTGSYSATELSGAGTYTVDGVVHHFTWDAHRS